MVSVPTFILGGLLWALAVWAGSVGFTLLRPQGRPFRPVTAAAWTFLMLGAILFLFRPEEEIAVGEDPAAYFHSAQAFARHGTLVYQDPALAQLPLSQRTLFRYGHAGFGYTKDACLWIKNPEAAEVGSWFQPAFPLLLSVPIAWFSPWSAFGVAPLFALLAALTLAGLVRRITDSSTVAMLAFALFLVHPAIAWNARCMRPEMPALFLALTGCAALATVDARAQRGFLSGCGSGLALASAVLFHITAVYIALPGIWLAAWLQGEASRIRQHADQDAFKPQTGFWSGWWSGMALGGMALVWQTMSITDPYNIRATLAVPNRQGLALAVGILFGAGALALRFAPWPTIVLAIKPLRHRRAPLLASIAVALLYIGAALWIFMHRTDIGHVPGLPRWLTGYLSLTDFRGIARLSSRLWSLMALAGVFCLLSIGRGTIGSARKRLFLLLAPASLTIGWMFNYMFETRRATTALVPLMILATAALLDTVRAFVPALAVQVQKRTRFPATHWAAALRLQIALPCLLALGLAGAAMRGRTALYTLRNHRGTYDHYKTLSNRIAEHADVLFAEYTQTTAPIEHFSGVPLLPIAWGYRSDEEYRRAEAALTERVQADPSRRYLFATPFTGTILPGLTLTPMFSQTLATRRLARTRGVVPSAIQARTLSLHIHEVSPNNNARDAATPYLRIMDGSRLGLSGAASVMYERTLDLHGVPLATDAETAFAFERNERADSFVLVLAIPAGPAPETLTVAKEGRIIPARRAPLCPGWEMLEIEMDASASGIVPLTISSSEPAFVTQVLSKPRPGGIGAPQKILSATRPFVMEGQVAQWLLANAALALPNMNTPHSVWTLATSARKDGVSSIMTMRPRIENAPAFKHSLGSGWRWHVASLPAAPASDKPTQWHDLQVEPPWNPNIARFPSDLGLLVHAVIVHPDR